jgi:hypothetical protein
VVHGISPSATGCLGPCLFRGAINNLEGNLGGGGVTDGTICSYRLRAVFLMNRSCAVVGYFLYCQHGIYSIIISY